MADAGRGDVTVNCELLTAVRPSRGSADVARQPRLSVERGYRLATASGERRGFAAPVVSVSWL